MTTVQLTDAQLAQFTACRVIVVDGDLFTSDRCDTCAEDRTTDYHDEHDHAQYHGGKNGRVAPELWRKLTDPCNRKLCVNGRLITEHAAIDVGPCPDCVGGRQVVTLTAWQCEECARPWTYGRPQCGQCGNRTRIPIEFGRFTIRLLPVVAWNSLPKITQACIEVAPAGFCQVWARNDRWRPDDPSSTEFVHHGINGGEWTRSSEVDPLPQPGQWCVAFEAVAP